MGPEDIAILTFFVLVTVYAVKASIEFYKEDK